MKWCSQGASDKFHIPNRQTDIIPIQNFGDTPCW